MSRTEVEQRIKRTQLEDWVRIFHETWDVFIDPENEIVDVEVSGEICRFRDGSIVTSTSFILWYVKYFGESLEICEQQWAELVSLWLDISVEANLKGSSRDEAIEHDLSCAVSETEIPIRAVLVR